MVGLVSGNALGLENTSLRTLGQFGVIGDSSYGARTEQAFVNLATGNLVVQNRDEWFAGVGGNTAATRTYNSRGLMNEGNADSWLAGHFARRLTFESDADRILRETPDGAVTIYVYDAAFGAYLNTDGAGAYDWLTNDGPGSGYTWIDGATGASEQYDSEGSLSTLSDDRGNTIQFQYVNGRLDRMVNEANEGFRFVYNAAGRLGSIRFQERDGTEVVRTYYSYDALGRLSRVNVDLSPADKSTKNGDQLITTYAYDGDSTRLSSVAQRDGSGLHFTYIRTGDEYRVETVTDAEGAMTRLDYDVSAMRTTVTGPNGGTTAYQYDATGQLVRIEMLQADGRTASTSFAYTTQGDVEAVTDPLGHATFMRYDPHGNRIYERSDVGEVVERVYDHANRLTRETRYAGVDPDGDGAALPSKPLTCINVYEPQAGGGLRFQVGAQGRVVEHQYGAFGLVSTTWEYAGATFGEWPSESGSAPSLEQLVEWAGAHRQGATRTDYTYDHRGQIETRTTWNCVDAEGAPIVASGSASMRFAYDHLGQLVQTIGPRGGTHLYAYDGAGRLLAETNEVGETTGYAYGGGAGRFVTTRHANGLVNTQYFDRRGLLIATADASATGTALGRSLFWYDKLGNLVMTKNPVGARSWMLYDDAGRKVADIDARGSLTEYVRDATGNLVQTIQYATAVSTGSLTDAATGLPTTPKLSELRPIAGADRKTWYLYDASGRVIQTVALEDPASNLATVEATNFDGAGRVTSSIQFGTRVDTTGWGGSATAGAATPTRSPEDRETIHFHDRDGLQIGSLDPEGYLTQFQHDGAGRVVVEKRFAVPIDQSRRDESIENLLPPEHPDDQIRRFFHNSRGQLSGVMDPEGYLLEKSYDEAGNLIETIRYATKAMLNGPVAQSFENLRPSRSPEDEVNCWTYDDLNRVVWHLDSRQLRTEYVYDNAGNIVETVRIDGRGEDRATRSRYDLLGRLTAELAAEDVARLATAETEAGAEEIWADRALKYTYDAAGHRTSATDSNGRKTVYYYSATGEETFRVNANGEVTRTGLDTWGRITAVGRYGTAISTLDLLGGVDNTKPTRAANTVASSSLDSWVRRTYRLDGEVHSETNEVGVTTTHKYSSFGELKSSATQLSAGKTYLEERQYDRRGLLKSITRDVDGEGLTTQYVYDAFGRLKSEIDPLGRTRSISYDRLGRMIAIADAAGESHTTYDAFDRVLRQVDANGFVTEYRHDRERRSLSIISPDGVAVTTEFDQFGMVSAVTDGRDIRSDYTYDENGNQRSVTRGGITTRTIYASDGLLAEAVDGAGIRTTYQYDAANRLLHRTVNAGGANELITTYEYDAKGRQYRVTDPAGSVTEFKYDLKGRLIRSTVDPDGLKLITSYSYDAQGNVLTVTDPRKSVTRYTYDKLGRRWSEQCDVGGQNLMRQFRYDKAGNLISSTVPAGAATRYTYDDLNREVFRIDPLGSVQEIRYDALSRVVETRHYGTSIAIAEMGTQPTTEVVRALLRPDTAVDRFERRFYTADGRLSGTMDATGAVLRFTYDNNGNVLRTERFRVTATDALTDLPAPEVAQDVFVDRYSVYDSLNRPIFSIDGAGGVTAYTYDGCGRVTSQARYARTLTLPRSLELSDLVADVQALASADRVEVIRHVYDAAGRLTWRVDGAGGVMRHVYDGNGNVVEKVVYATNISLSTPCTEARLAEAVRTAASDQRTINRFDSAGRREWTVDGTGAVVRFRYDANGNLTARTQYANTQAPDGFDPGNIHTSSFDRETRFTYDGANRLEYTIDALGGVTANTYDNAGNLTRETRYAECIDSTVVSSGDIAMALKPSGLDRMTQSAYDAAGRRIYFADAEGAVTETRYNLFGQVRMTRQYAATIAHGTLAATASLAAWQPLLSASNQDRVTSRIHDAGARVIYTIDPEGAITEQRYDGAGRTESVMAYFLKPAIQPAGNAAAILAAVVLDPLNDRVERYRYDDAGQLVMRTDALGIEEKFEYDGAGRRTARTDGNRNRWTYTYDAAGRLKSEASPPVERARALILAGGDLGLRGGLAPVPVTTVFDYDGAGNLTRRTDAYGLPERRATSYEYDALGRRIATKVAGALVYDESSDDLSNSANAARHEVVRDLVERTRFSVFGDVIAQTDAAGNTSYREYDAVGRVRFEADALGHVIAYERNAFGDSESIRRYANPSLIIQAAHPDALPSIANPSASSLDRQTQFRFDRVGRVVEAVEQLDHAFDAANNTFLHAPSHSVFTTYTAFGEMSTVRDGASTTNHFFDRNGRETATVDAEGYLTRQTYDALGNMLTRTEHAHALTGASITGARQGKAPLAPAAAEADRVWTYGYDPLGRRKTETLTGIAAASSTVGISNAVVSVEPSTAPHFAYVRAPGEPTAIDIRLQKSSAGWLQWQQPLQGVTFFRWRRENDTVWNDGTDQVLSVSGLQTFAFANDMPAGSYEIQVINDLNGQRLAQGQGTLMIAATGASVRQLTVGASSGVAPAGLSIGTVDGGSVITWGAPSAGRTVQFRYRAVGATDWIVSKAETSLDGASQHVVVPNDMAAGTYDIQIEVTQHGAGRKETRTSWSHDALGNVTREVDAEGGETYRYYDAVGRLTAVITPAVEGVAGLPLTQYFYDAHGSQVGSAARGSGATQVSQTGYVAAAPNGADRLEINRFDGQGHLTQTTDAAGVSRFHSYDAAGRLAKSWQTVETESGLAVAYQVFCYDAAGRLTEQVEPAARGAGGLTASTKMTYDAFGSITSRTVSGAETEWWRYDVSGRLWMTNEGDGVERVLLHDLQGRNTMDIRSAGTVDVQAFHTALEAWQSYGTRKTISRYDLLGRMVGQTLPNTLQVEGEADVVQVRAQRGTIVSDTPQFGLPRWNGENSVQLTWTDLTILGSGDVKVEMAYMTKAYALAGEDVTVDRSERVLTRTFTSEQAATGVRLVWTDQGEAGGIDGVQGFAVYKKDRDGQWQRVIHQARQEGASNLMVIKAPGNAVDAVTVQWKPAGAPSSDFQTAVSLMRFGDAIAFDLTGALDGRYDYEVWTQTADSAQLIRTSAATLTLAPPPLASLAVPVLAQPDAPWILSWTTPLQGTQQTWRYRASNGAGVWMSLPVIDRPDGQSCVDVRLLPSGLYQFELLHAAAGVPFAHAIGKLDIAGLPGIDATFAAHADGSAVISWPRREDVEAAFRYRPAGTLEWELAAPADFVVNAQTGRQSINIVATKVPGPYEVELQFIQGGQPIASHTGVVTVCATALRPDLVDSTIVVDSNLPATLTRTSNTLGTTSRLDARFSTQADGTWQLDWPQPVAGFTTVVRFRHESTDFWHEAPAARILNEWGRQRVVLSPTDWLGGTWEIDIRQVNAWGTMSARYRGAVTVHPPAMLMEPFAGADVGASMAGDAVTGDWWLTTKAPATLGASVVEVRYRLANSLGAYTTVQIPGPVTDGKVRLSVAAGAMPAGTDYEMRIVYLRTGLPNLESTTRIRIGSSRGRPDSMELVEIPVALETRPDGTWSMAWACPGEGVSSQLRLSGPLGAEVLPLTRSGSIEFYADSDLRPPGTYQVELVQMRAGVTVGLYRGELLVPDDVVAALPLVRTARDDGSWSLTWASPAAGLTAHAEFGYAATTFRVNRDTWIRQNANATMSVVVGPWDVVGEAWDLVAADAVVNVYLQAADGRRVSQGSTLVRLREPSRTPSIWTPTPRKCSVEMVDAGVSAPLSSAPDVEWVIRSETNAPTFSVTASGGSRFEWADPLHSSPVFRYRRWGEIEWSPGTVQGEGVNRPFVTLPPTLAPGDYEFQMWNGRYTFIDFSAGTLRVPQPGSGGASMVPSAVAPGQSQSMTLQAQTQRRLDRWGNVLALTDPRQSDWVTTFRYDLNDCVIEESRPGPAGETAASERMTSWAENDALGRITSSTDANGHTTRQRWDHAGNLIAESYADGAAVTYRYNVFGDRIAKVDELNIETAYAYDAQSRLRKTTYAATNSYQFDIASDVWGLVRDASRPRMIETVDYDRAGRKTRQVNGAGEETLYRYDVRGNLTTVTQGGLTTEWRYDNRGRRLSQTDGAGASATWWYEDFRIKGRTDIGGNSYAYTYDHASQLVHEISSGSDITRRKDITYAYDAAGQLIRQLDASTNKVSEYAYDLAGNRITERTRQGMLVDGVARYVTYQDNELAYDALGRLRWVADGRARVEIDYDQVGNRTRIQTHVINGDTSQDSSLHFQYDVRNRQVVANAVNRHGELGSSGHRMAYDKAGNKVSDAWQGRVVVRDLLGAYRSAMGLTNEVYTRDALGRITSVSRDGVAIDRRHYDGAGRIVQSGVNTRPEDYLVALNGTGADGKALEGNGTELRQSLFDANGDLRMQQVLNAAGSDFKYRTVYYDEANPTVINKDKAGNLLGYAVVNRESNENIAYTYTYQRADGYQQTDLDVLNRTTEKSGHTDFRHDGNGYLVRVEDLKQAANNRDLVNDAEGRLLYANQGGHVQRQLVANGEVFGRFGEVADDAVPRSRNGVSTYKPIADFDFAFAPAAGKPGQLTPSSHVVGAGDTLQSIAHAAYGDSRLWYRIAEANGVLKNSELISGQVLTIPQAELSLNGASTFKPYDAASAIGDTSPHVPLPSPKKTNWFGQLLALVVTIVVSAYMPGLLGANLGAFSTAVVSSAAGSIAGQAVGVATGVQEEFNWNGVALSAVTAGIGEFVPKDLLGTTTNSALNAVAKAVVTNTASQAVAVAVGAQSKFDWRGVAAAGVGAGIGQSISDPLKKAVESQFMGGLLAGLVAGGAAAAMRGRRVTIQQVAIGAFGNALDQWIGDVSTGGQPTLKTGDFTRMDGSDYRDEPYETPNAADGLTPGGMRYGLQLTGGAIAAMDEGINELRGHRTLIAMRDTEIDATDAAEVARRQASWRLPPSQAWSGGAGGGRGFVNPEGINIYASTAGGAPSPLPAGWNMRDAHAAAFHRDYEVRLLNSPSVTAWSGVTNTQRLSATAGAIDAIAGNPLGAAGFLVGKAAGVNNADATTFALVGATAGELLSLRAGLKGSKVESYVSGLYRKDTPTHTPAGLFEVEQTGRYNYRVVGGATAVDIDGYRATTILEAKHVGDVARSPYIPESGAPAFIREKILKEQQYEFQRLKAVVSDPAVPFTRVEVLTNHNDAVPYFRALMSQYEVPGVVRVVPTRVSPLLSGKRQP